MKQCRYLHRKQDIDYEFTQIEEFYFDLKEKLTALVDENYFDEEIKFFLVKIFNLDNVPDEEHFNIINFIKKIKDFSDVNLL